MVMPVRAGSLRSGCNCHGPQRQPACLYYGDGDLGVAASMLLILAHDRPFTGEISIRPDALLQVMPEIGA